MQQADSLPTRRAAVLKCPLSNGFGAVTDSIERNLSLPRYRFVVAYPTTKETERTQHHYQTWRVAYRPDVRNVYVRCRRRRHQSRGRSCLLPSGQ